MGQIKTRLSMFKDSLRKPKDSPTDITPIFSDSVQLASARTQEYLLFQDPENKFWPTGCALNEIFLMTYITQSVQLRMPDTFICTAMTREQRVLLGADWVWAVVEASTRNPLVQVAVQVLHMQGRESEDASNIAEAVRLTCSQSASKTKLENMIDFCASIGQDCYALFLFFGRSGDPGNIYGVLSNNFRALCTRGSKLNQAFIEGFFKGTRYVSTPAAMIQTVTQRQQDGPLTMLIKFS
ncbi:rab15 effector protein-like [Anguilla rostrata]|uniref:rab15 effector protein-like n=1 Tax=Anguilla anguilla TaxID=7936 RepID=UPI0015ADAC2B|nr:rab15 effector protein-like [Anguilla anguilla]